jgi:hypothetical protein
MKCAYCNRQAVVRTRARSCLATCFLEHWLAVCEDHEKTDDWMSAVAVNAASTVERKLDGVWIHESKFG